MGVRVRVQDFRNWSRRMVRHNYNKPARGRWPIRGTGIERSKDLVHEQTIREVGSSVWKEAGRVGVEYGGERKEDEVP